MKTIAWWLFLACLSLPALRLATASDQRWRLMHDNNDIKVYIHNIPRADMVEFRGITRINASVDNILAILGDHSACPELIYRCNKAELIKIVSFTERFHYQELSLLFPVHNRDFIIHTYLAQNRVNNSFIISMIARPDYCKDKTSLQCRRINNSADIRVRSSFGYILLEPMNVETTRVTWNQHTDLGGKLPAWLVNQLIIDMPLWSLTNLKKLAKKAKYQHSQLVYDNQGIAVDIITIQQKKVLGQKISVKPFFFE